MVGEQSTGSAFGEVPVAKLHDDAFTDEVKEKRAHLPALGIVRRDRRDQFLEQVDGPDEGDPALGYGGSEIPLVEAETAVVRFDEVVPLVAVEEHPHPGALYV